MKLRLVTLVAILVSTMFLGILMASEPVSAANGARNDLEMYYYADDTALWAALQAGDIDFTNWECTPAQYAQAITNPDIMLAPVNRLDFRSWSLNNNITIARIGHNVNSPMSHVAFRKAIHRLSDKNYYSQVICGGFSVPLPVPVAGPSSSWYSPDAVNYALTQLSFSVSGAAALLDADGFAQGTTVNPDFNPGVPGSAQYMRVYPPTTQSNQAWIIATSPLPNQPNLPIGQASYALPLKYAVVGDPTDKANLEVWFDATTSYASLDPATDYTYDAPTKTVTVTKVFNAPIGPLATVNKRFHVIYKHAHQKAGLDLDGIVFWARNDDVLRFAASQHLRARMLESGIPVNWNPADNPTCYAAVMSARNYHIYSAGWSMARFPTNLYGFFHSNRWFAGGSNYHSGEVLTTMSSFTTQVSPVAHYKDVDYYAYQVQYPPDYESAKVAARATQDLLVTKYCVMVPMWSSRAYYPYRNLLNVVNLDGTGPENDYTYMSAYRVDNPSAPIRFGLKSPPLEINQIYSRWVWDVSTMGPVIAATLGTPAYDILTDIPWLCQEQEIGVWLDPDDGKSKTKVTRWYRDDAEWVKPVTGDILADFDTQWLAGDGPGRSGSEFNQWYFDAEPGGWVYTSYRDIKMIRTYPLERKLEVYFDTYSYWNQYNGYGRILYASSDPTFPGWKQAPLVVDGDLGTPGTQPTTATFAGPIAANAYLPLPIRSLGTPVEIVEIKEGATTLTPVTDYEMVGGVVNGPRIRMYKAIALGSSITVKYYGRGDPAGYNPGGLGWQYTLVGANELYMSAHTSGAGGASYYKRNTNFFLEIPPYGELDYVWYYLPGPKPRDGYFQVDIYDAVLGTGAFESQGYAVPGAYWRPGADLATSPSFPTPPFPTPTPGPNKPGAIDGYDIGVIGADYGKIFGSPP